MDTTQKNREEARRRSQTGSRTASAPRSRSTQNQAASQQRQRTAKAGSYGRPSAPQGTGPRKSAPQPSAQELADQLQALHTEMEVLRSFLEENQDAAAQAQEEIDYLQGVYNALEEGLKEVENYIAGN